ncbi:hypothetical protein AN641_03030 [Candidatus Epulonipiscioides gigas]|nr:hypothetical protein AN641_03030 [Epulopiscium sp. SCG-C07WGA-EpuloA2]
MSDKKNFILLFILGLLFMLLSYLIRISTGSAFAGYVITGAVIILCVVFSIYRRRHFVIAQNAHIAYTRKQFDTAYNLYEKAIALNKCPEEIKVVYAYKLLVQGHKATAEKLIASINEALLNKEGTFNLKVVKGILLFKNDELKPAIELYESLIKEDSSPQLYEILGILLNNYEDYEKARDFSKMALEKYPDNNIIKENLATSYFYLYEDKKARKLYKELMNFDVTYPEPYYYYARIAFLDERYNLALKYIEIAETKTPSYLSNVTMDVVSELKSEIEAELDKIPDELYEIEIIDETEHAEKVTDVLEIENSTENIEDLAVKK